MVINNFIVFSVHCLSCLSYRKERTYTDWWSLLKKKNLLWSSVVQISWFSLQLKVLSYNSSIASGEMNHCPQYRVVFSPIFLFNTSAKDSSSWWARLVYYIDCLQPVFPAHYSIKNNDGQHQEQKYLQHGSAATDRSESPGEAQTIQSLVFLFSVHLYSLMLAGFGRVLCFPKFTSNLIVFVLLSCMWISSHHTTKLSTTLLYSASCPLLIQPVMALPSKNVSRGQHCESEVWEKWLPKPEQYVNRCNLFYSLISGFIINL